MIYDDLEYEHEADIFANQMKYVKALLPYEIFMANIEAGNDKELNIKALVEDFGMMITPSACLTRRACSHAESRTCIPIRRMPRQRASLMRAGGMAHKSQA